MTDVVAYVPPAPPSRLITEAELVELRRPVDVPRAAGPSWPVLAVLVFQLFLLGVGLGWWLAR